MCRGRRLLMALEWRFRPFLPCAAPPFLSIPTSTICTVMHSVRKSATPPEYNRTTSDWVFSTYYLFHAEALNTVVMPRYRFFRLTQLHFGFL